MLPDAAEVDGTQHANGAGLEVIFTSDSRSGPRRRPLISRLRKKCQAAAPAAKAVMKTSCLAQALKHCATQNQSFRNLLAAFLMCFLGPNLANGDCEAATYSQHGSGNY
jgi:hypothetical protein